VQLDQAIINLAVNARDAMPHGGTLRFLTERVALAAITTTDGDFPAGDYVRISVSDNGSGIDEATQARIFEPFFTTKTDGKGTGLGLAMVYGFVRQSGGQINVFSKLSEGTRFVIDLPSVEAATAKPSADGGRALPRGSETLLLVEDEDSVRAWTKHVLESCGYRVLEASHGMQALAIAAAQTRPIDLLVTDVVMPRMSGRQVAEALVEKHPHIKVLFVSGYTDDAVMRRGIMDAAAAFLQKPFSAAALAHKVRTLLDAKSAASAPITPTVGAAQTLTPASPESSVSSELH
jgi:CheY-like chemotaxis protein